MLSAPCCGRVFLGKRLREAYMQTVRHSCPLQNHVSLHEVLNHACHMLQMNGLLLSNSWAGFHMLLNPDYKAAVQWRFVNRAIDEVENDSVRPTFLWPVPLELGCAHCLLSCCVSGKSIGL